MWQDITAPKGRLLVSGGCYIPNAEAAPKLHSILAAKALIAEDTLQIGSSIPFTDAKGLMSPPTG